VTSVATLLRGTEEMVDDRLMPLREVEHQLGLSRWTLYDMIRSGKLPAVRLASGHYRVPASSVEALARGKVTPK